MFQYKEKRNFCQKEEIAGCDSYEASLENHSEQTPYQNQIIEVLDNIDDIAYDFSQREILRHQDNFCAKTLFTNNIYNEAKLMPSKNSGPVELIIVGSTDDLT